MADDTPSAPPAQAAASPEMVSARDAPDQRARRASELEQIRQRQLAGALREQLDSGAAAAPTNFDSWQMQQRQQAAESRRKQQETRDNLHRYQGNADAESVLAKRAKAEEERRKQSEAKASLHSYRGTAHLQQTAQGGKAKASAAPVVADARAGDRKAGGAVSREGMVKDKAAMFSPGKREAAAAAAGATAPRQPMPPPQCQAVPPTMTPLEAQAPAAAEATAAAVEPESLVEAPALPSEAAAAIAAPEASEASEDFVHVEADSSQPESQVEPTDPPSPDSSEFVHVESTEEAEEAKVREAATPDEGEAEGARESSPEENAPLEEAEVEAGQSAFVPPILADEEKKLDASPATQNTPTPIAPPAPKTPEPVTPQQKATMPAPMVRDVSAVSSISKDGWDDDTNASSVMGPPSTMPEPSKAGTMARGVSALSCASSKASMMRHDVDFSFGLIARRERAPGTGQHRPTPDVYSAAAGGTDDRVSTVDRYMAAAEGVVEEYLSKRAHAFKADNPFSDSSRVEDVSYDPDYPPYILEIVDDVHYAPPANQSTPQRGYARRETVRRFVRAAVPVFVKRNDVDLAKRVRKELLDALRMAVMDGSFAQAANRPTTDEAFGSGVAKAR